MKKKKTVKPVKMCAETAAFLDELFGERDVYSKGYKHLLDLLFALQDEKGYGADEQLNDFGKKLQAAYDDVYSSNFNLEADEKKKLALILEIYTQKKNRR